MLQIILGSVYDTRFGFYGVNFPYAIAACEPKYNVILKARDANAALFSVL